MKFGLLCWVLLTCAGCNTLENRRDLYSHDVPFYYERPKTTTTVQQTTTTTTPGPPEFRSHAHSLELPEVPGD